tara:strand:- start:7596 stop:8006 length:411 start_codon:yes stop_codon:yes gene_type:complete
MRNINKIIVHCSATPESKDVTIDTIRKEHVEDNGYSDIGYHWIIPLSGSVEKGRPESISGKHSKDFNKNSIGVCYIGGVDKDMNPKDTRTEGQKETLKCLLEDIKDRYPNAEIIGHRNISSNTSPSFDAKAEYNNI